MEKEIVKISRKVLSKEKEINLKLDYIVPDVKPDIVAIIDTNASTYISNEGISNAKIRLDGNVDSKVIYLSDSGEIRSLSVILDFSEVMEDEKINPEFRYYSSVELLSIETKIINERKIFVSAKIVLYVSFYETNEIEFITSFEGFDNLQLKEEKCKIKSLIGENKAKSSLKEIIECDTLDNILDILKVDFKLSDIENKISYNKVLSKADCEIKIVYKTEDMSIKLKTVNYPIMSFVDIENVKEEHIIETSNNLKNMQVFLTQNEQNKINVNLEFETIVKAFETKEISVIEDIYSLNKEIEFTKKEFDAELDCDIIKNTFSVFNEVELEDVSEIIESSSSLKVVGYEQIENYTNYNVCINVKIMYLLDSRRGISVKNISFNTIIKIETYKDSEIKFTISKESLNLHGDKLGYSAEILSCVKKDCYKNISILEDIKEQGEVPSSEYSMIIYFVKPKDTIWKIAKNFKVSMQSIIDNNNLENPDKINIGDRLYIVK